MMESLQPPVQRYEIASFETLLKQCLSLNRSLTGVIKHQNKLFSSSSVVFAASLYERLML